MKILFNDLIPEAAETLGPFQGCDSVRILFSGCFIGLLNEIYKTVTYENAVLAWSLKQQRRLALFKAVTLWEFVLRVFHWALKWNRYNCNTLKYCFGLIPEAAETLGPFRAVTVRILFSGCFIGLLNEIYKTVTYENAVLAWSLKQQRCLALFRAVTLWEFVLRVFHWALKWNLYNCNIVKYCFGLIPEAAEMLGPFQGCDSVRICSPGVSLGS